MPRFSGQLIDDEIIDSEKKPRFKGKLISEKSDIKSLSPEQIREHQERSAISLTRGEHPILAKAADIARGFTGTARGAMNLVGETYGLGEDIGEKVFPTKGTEPNLIGSLADPIPWMIGGGVSKALPYVPLMTKTAGKDKVSTSLIEKMLALGKNSLSGGATGAAIGGLSDESDATTGAGVGAAANMILPPAIEGIVNAGRAIKTAAYPSPGEIGVKAAGNKVDDIIDALQATKSGVPGVELNAGQASVPANNSEFAALQKLIAEKEAPSLYFGPAGNKGRQEAARVAAIREIGGTQKELESAVASRTATSNANYEAAFDEIVKRDPELRALWKNPYFKDEVGEAYKLLRAEANKRGEKMPITKNLTQFLQFVKEGLDARLQSVANPNAQAISKSTKKAVQDVKDQLLTWLDKKNPLYEEARISHIEMSKPINQMEVGQDLERALIAPATGLERASSFGNVVRNAETSLNKRSGKSIIEDLTPSQRKVIDAIEEDFKRNAAYKELAGKGGANLNRRIGAPEVPPTGWFQPIVSAARGWTNRLLGTGHEKALQKLAPIMENPEKMALLMKNASPKQRQVMNELLSRYIKTGAIIYGSQGAQQ